MRAGGCWARGIDLAMALGVFDKERKARVSGARREEGPGVTWDLAAEGPAASRPGKARFRANQGNVDTTFNLWCHLPSRSLS